MVKLVTEEYIQTKYGLNNDSGRSPKFVNEPLISDQELRDIIGLNELTATNITDTINRTTHKYKRLSYNHIHRRLLTLYNQGKIIKIDYGINGIMWKNNTKYKPKPTGFKAWMKEHAPNCKKLQIK